MSNEQRQESAHRLAGIDPALWLLTAVLALMAWYGIFGMIDDRPHPIHLWRNADCLSLTLNYHDNGMNFFMPELHNYISDNGQSGMTAGEFPGWYYFIAALWKIFGVSEALYRGVVGGLFIFSLLVTQRALTRLTGALWATLLSLWMFVHPALIYYGFAFLTNVPALSFALLGGSAFLHYAIDGRRKYLYIALVFFAIGGLLKVTALMLFCVIGVLLLLETSGLQLRRERPVFEHKLQTLIFMAAALVPILIWYLWAEDYNTLHGGKYTFNHIWPYWEADASVRERVISEVMNFTGRQIMAPFNWVLFGVAFLFLFISSARLPRLLWLVPLILNMGAVLYSILWFQAWADHDYYFINLYVVPFVTLVSAVVAMQLVLAQTIKRQVLTATMAVILLLSAWYTAEHLELRYEPDYDRDYFMVAKGEEGHLKYLFWDHSRHEGGLNDIEPKLLEWGVTEDDRVISVPDASYSITLYLMDRPGFTNMAHIYSSEKINRSEGSLREHIAKGATFLVVNEPGYEDRFPWILPFMTDMVGRHRSIRVFRLHADM